VVCLSEVPNSTLISQAYSNWPAFPSEHIDIDSTGPAGAARLAGATARTLFNLDGGAIGVYAFPAAVRMSAGLDKPFDCVEPGAQPVPLMQCFNDWLAWTTTEHTGPGGQPWAKDATRGNLFPFITPNYVGGLEEIGTTVAINDMLLLSSGRGNSTVLRLFPVWRHAAGAGPAKFTGLRAKGAFILGASYDNVTDEISDVVVTSDAGRRCAVVSPWAHASTAGTVVVIEEAGASGGSVMVTWWDTSAGGGGSVFEFATKAGRSYRIFPAAAVQWRP
jgi:hypothetical protein